MRHNKELKLTKPSILELRSLTPEMDGRSSIPGADSMWQPRALRLACTVATLLLTACYEADTAIDPIPLVDLDPAPLGDWRCLPFDTTDRVFDLSVTESRARVHGIVIEQGSSHYPYEAYASLVHGTRVLNLHDLGASKRPWSFVRYSFLTPQVVQIALLSKDAVDTSRSMSARTAVEGAKEPAYAPYCVCLRKPGDGEDGP